MVKENLDREIVKKSNHTSASFIVLTLSLGLLFMYTTTAVQWTQILTPAHAATTNQYRSKLNIQQTKQEKKCRLEPLMLHKELNLQQTKQEKKCRLGSR